MNLETALGATPEGYVNHPEFFAGFLARPDIAAAGMLSIADVAATRYFDLAKIRARFQDPVVTASGDRLRFESFSACNGVYARLDLLADGIDSGEVGFGTTNVDINQPLRSALAELGRGSLVHLTVGSELLRLSTPELSREERKVDLPDRWIRGFAETPAVAQRMAHVTTLRQPAISSFVSSLPRSAPGPSHYLVPGRSGLRPSLRAVPGSVFLAGTARLAAANRIARFTTELSIAGDDTGASAWTFTMPGCRLTLLLSPEPYRGFSGEGGLLTSLTGTDGAATAARLSEFLAWESTIDPAALAEVTDLTRSQVERGIAYLATSGKVGYDLAEAAWFHRELPITDARAERDNPRLAAARSLVESGAVTRDAAGWIVRSESSTHWVRQLGNDMSCTCIWWAKYRGQRGPCKHALAVTLLPRE